MATAFEQQRSSTQHAELSFDDRLGLLVDTEWTARESRKLAQRLRHAKLRYPASLEDVDFSTPRGLSREVVLSLGTGGWIRDHHHLLITGPTGIGKSWLASAFVQSACRHGFTATYVRAPRLLHELAVSRGDGSYGRLLAKLAKLDLLAIDDWLLAPLTDAERRDLLEVLEDRSERTSTLIASQLPPTAWHAAIGEPSVADAICDRLIHHAHRLTLKGPTMRDPGTRGAGAAAKGDERDRRLGHPGRSSIANGLWIVPDLWKTRRRVSHRSLDGAQNAPPTTLHRPFVSTKNRSRAGKMTSLMRGDALHALTTASLRSEE